MATFGVVVGVTRNHSLIDGSPYPARITIQRTIASTSSATDPSTTWTTIISQWGGAAGFDESKLTDPLPSDGVRRFYRVRQVSGSIQPSTWLGVIDAVPAQLTTGLLPPVHQA